ncbi:hypothetical protein GGS20DRAFT_542518 [Poronia punctata]|nr:hypothetical protein GGS20DRAFT_542518 [Poronia punctata]
MQLHSFVAAVGLAASSNALLLPPDLSMTDGDTISTLPVTTEVDVDAAIAQLPETRTLALKCPGCLRRGPNPLARTEIPSHLKLDFAVDSTGDADRLTVNGYELYPNPDPVTNTLVAPVVPDFADRHIGVPPLLRGGKNRPLRNRPLGFGMQTQTVATDEDHDMKLVNIEIQIIEVGNVFMETIPNVQVKLITSQSGKLGIGAIDTIDAKPTEAGKTQKTCNTTLCKWKTLFFEKLSHVFAFKGCGGSKAGSQSGPHHDMHHHAGTVGHNHHMGQKHQWGTIFMAFVSHILLPVLVGIVAGISASIIGMMVGTFVVFVWRTFFRRSGSRSSHRCRYARKVAKRENTVAEDEKSGLMENQEDVEAPPAYMDEGVAAADIKKPEDAA